VLLADDPIGASGRLTGIWSGCKRSHVIGESRFRQLLNLLGGHFMFNSAQLRRLFAQHVAARTFEELEIRFACVATDLRTGLPAILSDGPLLDALLATCAIPGVFPLIRRDGRLLADGGYVANVPVREAIDLGAASIVVFDGRPRIPLRQEPRDVRDSMTAAFAAALKRQYWNDVEYARTRVPVLCLPGQPMRHVKAFDFAACAEVIRHAHACVREYLATVDEPGVSKVLETGL
jgi:NTE family protein